MRNIKFGNPYAIPHDPRILILYKTPTHCLRKTTLKVFLIESQQETHTISLKTELSTVKI